MQDRSRHSAKASCDARPDHTSGQKTSAQGGDDGQVGQGNRASGLTTSYRAVALEAIAGKNPVSHVGKLYNVLAREIANDLVTTIPEMTAAQCIVVSQIGSPVTEPALAHARLATPEGFPVARLKLKSVKSEGAY